MNFQSIVSHLRSHACPEKAAPMSKYMKNHFTFLGLTSPERKSLAKDWLTTEASRIKSDGVLQHDEFKQLWELPEREFQYVACDLLVKVKNKLAAGDIELVEYLLRTKPWWDTVDLLSSHLLGQLVKNHPVVVDSHLRVWNAREFGDATMWLRRASILSQLNLKKGTNTDWLEEFIVANKDTDEFFLNKAIGWSLRQYARTDKKWVAGLLQKHEFHKLTKREATKHF